VIILHPGFDLGVVVQLEGFGRLLSAVIDAKIDVAARVVYSQGLPVYQVPMLPVERIGRSRSNTGSSFSVFSKRIASQMCWTTLVMLGVMMRRRLRLSADELLDEMNELGKQEFSAAFPILLHLGHKRPRGLEDDPLRAELPRQALQVYGGNLSHAFGLPSNDKGKFGNPGRLAGVKLQGLYSASPGQAGTVHMVDADDVRPTDLARRPCPLPARWRSLASAAPGSRRL